MKREIQYVSIRMEVQSIKVCANNALMLVIVVTKKSIISKIRKISFNIKRSIEILTKMKKGNTIKSISEIIE